MDKTNIEKAALSRRSMLKIGLLSIPFALLAAFRPSDNGKNHSHYFRTLSKTLVKNRIAKPTLVIDINALRKNIETLNSHIGERHHYRVVAKSLPSIPLIKLVLDETKSNRVMVFHQPFANALVKALPETDLLFGKPMPVGAANNFYDQLSASAFDSPRQLQWLIDSQSRLMQYRDLAEQRNQPMQINLEIDVGLHRGGINSVVQFNEMLNVIEDSPQLTFSGLMGYEPHIVKVPGSDPIGLRDEAMAIYQQFVDAATEFYGGMLPKGLTLNAAGSPSYQLYDEGEFPFNEISAGSCLVKPTDFDLDTLADHEAASFIATPVLKSMPQTQYPGIGKFGNLFAWLNPNKQQAFFTYGGYWKAKPVSPEGLIPNSLYGRSTNQDMLNGSQSISLEQDDWVFLRPTQSEFVFLQFGDIAVYDEEREEIVDNWPAFAFS